MSHMVSNMSLNALTLLNLSKINISFRKIEYELRKMLAIDVVLMKLLSGNIVNR